MATPNIKPRGDGEGGLGADDRNWGKAYFLKHNSRQNGTIYSVGDIAYSANLPTWARLQAVSITDVTASSEPDFSSITKGGVYINDGGVEWIVDDIRMPILVGTPFDDVVLRTGCVLLDGSTVNRADYPRLFQFASDNNLLVSNNATQSGLFGEGDGSATFVLPNYTGRYKLPADATIGSNVSEGLPNITGNLALSYIGASLQPPSGYNNTTSHGALVTTSAANYDFQKTSISTVYMHNTIQLDASQSNNIYGSSTKVQPSSVKVYAQCKY